MSNLLRHVHILSTKDVITSSGKELTITQDMLDSLARSYNHDTHKAPIVLGHTRDNEGLVGLIGRTLLIILYILTYVQLIYCNR